MKKIILGAAFVAIGTFATAQQTVKMQKMDPAQMEQKRADNLKKMKTDLDLSDAQVKQITAMQEARMAERKQNAPQMQAQREARMEAMQAKKMQHESEMKRILTPEQYTKWQVKKEDKMQHRKSSMKRHQINRK